MTFQKKEEDAENPAALADNCQSLALTSLPDGLTLSNIGLYAFLRCDSLALTRLPDGLTASASTSSSVAPPRLSN